MINILQNIGNSVRDALLTGLTTVTAATISATDTVLQALEKLQAQITANDSAAVHIAGTETITGGKTFTADTMIQEGVGGGIAPSSAARLLTVDSDQTNAGMSIICPAGGNANLYIAEGGNSNKAAHLQFIGSVNAFRVGVSNINVLEIKVDGAKIIEPLHLLTTTADDNLKLEKSNSTTSWLINAGRSAFFDNWLLFKNSGEAGNFTFAIKNSGAMVGKAGSAGAPTYSFDGGSNHGMSHDTVNDLTMISADGQPNFGVGRDRTEVRNRRPIQLASMTTTERDDAVRFTAEAGDMVYNTTVSKAQCFNGTIWNDLF